MAVMLAVGSFSGAACAEETLEVNWSEIEAHVEEAGLEGSFVEFEEAGYTVWLPDVFEEDELTDEDKEEGYIGYYVTEDESAVVAVMHVEWGLSLEDYKEYLAGEETVSELEDVILNGVPCVSYDMEENDTTSVALVTDEGYILEFTFAPMSDEEFSEVAVIIASSIQPIGTEEAEEASTEA